MTKSHPTTKIAYLNRNGQLNIRPLGIPGTDHGQSLYQLACTHCGHNYAANGSDIHLRKCPACQDGNPSTGGWSPNLTLNAQKHCSRHRAEIEASVICGCFFCRELFEPSEIEEWTDEGQTAICPRCGIDSVLGTASGYPMTAGFLQVMYDQWFGS